MTKDNFINGISVVIPNWNGLYLLKQSLDPLLKATSAYDGESEIIVVDNGSQDRSVDVLMDYYPTIKILRFDENKGFGYACNAGVEIAQFSHVLLLNNDIYLPEDFLIKMTVAFGDHPGAFSVTPQTNYWRGKELTSDVFSSSINITFDINGELIQQWAVCDCKNTSVSECPTFYGTGAALLVDKDKFTALGGFDSIYGLAYWEDIDLCLKAWRNGWASYYTGSVVAWHKVSATTSNGKEEFKNRLMLLNYVIFHLSNITNSKITAKFLYQLSGYLFSLMRNGEGEEAVFILGNLFKSIGKIFSRRIKVVFLSKKSLQDVIRNVPVPLTGWNSEPLLTKNDKIT